jgi:hypothetical protein
VLRWTHAASVLVHQQTLDWDRAGRPGGAIGTRALGERTTARVGTRSATRAGTIAAARVPVIAGAG